MKAIKQSEYLDAIERAKKRMDNKNTFFVKQLQDEIAREKWEKDFWYNKYKNLKNDIGLFFPKKGMNEIKKHLKTIIESNLSESVKVKLLIDFAQDLIRYSEGQEKICKEYQQNIKNILQRVG